MEHRVQRCSDSSSIDAHYLGVPYSLLLYAYIWGGVSLWDCLSMLESYYSFFYFSCILTLFPIDYFHGHLRWGTSL